MAKYGIYTIKDVLANTFTGVTLFISQAEAERSFSSQVNNIDIWRDNPNDFELWRVGEYDSTTGTVGATEEFPVEKINSGSAYVRR